MKRILLSACVFAAVLAAQTAPPMGEGPRPFGGPRMDAVKTALNLTDDRITRLVDLQKARREELRPAMENLRETTVALKEKVEAADDPAEIGSLVLRIETLRKQIKGIHEDYHNRAVGVLDATQQDLLQKLVEAIKLQPAIGQAHALNLLEAPEARGQVNRMGSQRGPGGPRMRGGRSMPAGRNFRN